MKKILYPILFLMLSGNALAQDRPAFSDNVVNARGARYLPYHKGNYAFGTRQRGDDQFIKPKDFGTARALIVKTNDILRQSTWINSFESSEVI